MLFRSDKNGKIPNKDDHLIDDMRYIFNAASYDFTKLPDDPIIDVDDIINKRAIDDFLEYVKDNDLNLGYGDIIGEFYE